MLNVSAPQEILEGSRQSSSVPKQGWHSHKSLGFITAHYHIVLLCQAEDLCFVGKKKKIISNLEKSNKVNQSKTLFKNFTQEKY